MLPCDKYLSLDAVLLEPWRHQGSKCHGLCVGSREVMSIVMLMSAEDMPSDPCNGDPKFAEESRD
jgi:hypothetical protein